MSDNCLGCRGKSVHHTCVSSATPKPEKEGVVDMIPPRCNCGIPGVTCPVHKESAVDTDKELLQHIIKSQQATIDQQEKIIKKLVTMLEDVAKFKER